LVQHELLVLLVLAAIATGTFVFTRAAAAHDRAADQRAASAWFDAGRRALDAGDVRAGIRDLRQSVLNAPRNVEYRLALAGALGDNRRADEARRILLSLREDQPENGRINLALARLAATRADAAEATRYYHHALYGVWDGGGIIAPETERAVRIELIRLLLANGQTSQARSQALLLEQDLPDTADAHAEIAQLFVRTGSLADALTHFERAAQIAPGNAAALSGAATTAFDLGDYARAARLLQSARTAGTLSPALAEVAPVIDAIIQANPLALRLSAAQRSRRLTAALDRAIERASYCAPGANAALDEALSSARTIRPSLAPAETQRHPELVDSTFDLVVHLEQRAGGCQPETATDRALLLLGRTYAQREP
jgi:tetratricopeptide (TPR) repeat protein